MLASAVELPKFVKAVKEFQQLGLVNKAVIDVAAVDVPLVVLAKNETERKERLLRQALVLLVAFMIAPFHGRLVSNAMSRTIGLSSEINQQLMKVSFKNLGTKEQLKKGVHTLYQSLEQQVPKELVGKIDDVLRKNIVKAKTRFLMADLAVCGLLLSSIGFIKVMFGKLLSGKDQFTGEFGIVSEKTLDKIYEKEGADNKKYLKSGVTFATAIGVPILASALIAQALKGGTPKGFNRFMANWLAPKLDYNYPQYVKKFKNWPLLSDGSQILLSLLLTMGELTSARSPRELKELAIQRNSIDFMFFFGAPIFMRMIAGSTTVQGAIDKAQKVATKAGKKFGAKKLKSVATRSAWSYLASFMLTLAGVSGIIAFTNRMTRQAVKEEAKTIDIQPKNVPKPRLQQMQKRVRPAIIEPKKTKRMQRPSVETKKETPRLQSKFSYTRPVMYQVPYAYSYVQRPHIPSYWQNPYQFNHSAYIYQRYALSTQYWPQMVYPPQAV